MLTRILLLAAIWLELSLIVLLLRGKKPQKSGWTRSILFFLTIVLAGDIWALLSFGQLREIIGFSIFALIFAIFWIIKLRDWNGIAHAFWVSALLTTMLYIVYSFATAAFTPLHPLAFIAALILSFMEAAVLILTLSFGFENLDVFSRLRWHRRFKPSEPSKAFMPLVSLHMPISHESFEVLEKSLRSLAALDYPNYEVLLLDTRVSSENEWRAMVKLCTELGPRFRFFHLHKWPGNRAGVLNFALSQTHPHAALIGIVGAYHELAPEFLKELVPYFAHQRLAFIQTALHYHGKPYLESADYARKYQFEISMPSRNEANAISLAATTNLISRRILQEVGAWDDGCLSEETEASLRMLKRGYESVYIDKVYASPLLPLSFASLKHQRFRQSFGNIQILKKHLPLLMPWSHWINPSNHLSQRQRYFYLMGSLQCFNDALMLCFTILLIFGAGFALIPQASPISPIPGSSLLVLVLFLFLGMWRFLWLLRSTMQLKPAGIIRALGAFYSLSFTSAIAFVRALIQLKPKSPRIAIPHSRFGFLPGLGINQGETLMGAICLFLAIGLSFAIPQPANFVFYALLACQALLYFLAPNSNDLRLTQAALAAADSESANAKRENRIVRVAIGLILALLVGIGATFFLPPPTRPPVYSQFQPPEIQLQVLIGLPMGVRNNQALLARQAVTDVVMNESLDLLDLLSSSKAISQTSTASLSTFTPIIASSSTATLSPTARVISTTLAPGSTIVTSTPVPATQTSIPTLTATLAPILPTATFIPSTATPIPIIPSVPPTSTPVPVIPTQAPIIPTVVPIVPTVIQIIPTLVPILPTNSNP